jgi:Flp pilus assembly pilin Flp
MSDLITTAQDSFREQCIEAFVGLQAMAERLAERMRDDRGQTAAEYMGILFVVSAIIVGVVGAHLGDALKERLGKIVTAIGNGVTP